MKKNAKNVLVIVVALALVIVVGKFSADHWLKATDGEENVVTEVTETTEAVTEEIEVSTEIVLEGGTEEADTEEPETEVENTEVEATETESTEAAEEETAKSERSITISSSLDGVETVEPGTMITLYATLEGYDDVAYIIQWQRTLDGENWEDISGATELQYTLAITDETDDYVYRVMVDVEE